MNEEEPYNTMYNVSTRTQVHGDLPFFSVFSLSSLPSLPSLCSSSSLSSSSSFSSLCPSSSVLLYFFCSYDESSEEGETVAGGT